MRQQVAVQMTSAPEGPKPYVVTVRVIDGPATTGAPTFETPDPDLAYEVAGFLHRVLAWEVEQTYGSTVAE